MSGHAKYRHVQYRIVLKISRTTSQHQLPDFFELGLTLPQVISSRTQVWGHCFVADNEAMYGGRLSILCKEIFDRGNPAICMISRTAHFALAWDGSLNILSSSVASANDTDIAHCRKKVKESIKVLYNILLCRNWLKKQFSSICIFNAISIQNSGWFGQYRNLDVSSLGSIENHDLRMQAYCVLSHLWQDLHPLIIWSQLVHESNKLMQRDLPYETKFHIHGTFA